jgi:hypothetical protein
MLQAYSTHLTSAALYIENNFIFYKYSITSGYSGKIIILEYYDSKRNLLNQVANIQIFT